jgi:hypothetical protein
MTQICDLLSAIIFHFKGEIEKHKDKRNKQEIRQVATLLLEMTELNPETPRGMMLYQLGQRQDTKDWRACRVGQGHIRDIVWKFVRIIYHFVVEFFSFAIWCLFCTTGLVNLIWKTPAADLTAAKPTAITVGSVMHTLFLKI